MNFNNYLKELKRRNVIKACLAYLVASWIIIQVISSLLPIIGAPDYVGKLILVFLIIGFPFWLIFSWVYEITPEGIKRTVNVKPEESIVQDTSNRLNKIIIGGLAIAIALLLFNIFKSPSVSPTETNEVANGVFEDKSIAVLAFADMSPEKDQEYFSDGISEEILNLLAKIPELKVISRTSSFSFKGKEVTTAEIGKALNVAHILEGSIRKSGNTFRITAQLINVSDGAHVWSETYDRDMTDIFEIQDEIAATVTKQLKVTLLGNAITSKTLNPEAYTLYLQAKQLMIARSIESTNSAEQLIKSSIAIDSNYAPSWSLYSQIVYRNFANYMTMSITEGIKQGKVKAEKAIILDPNYAIAYGVLADYNRSEWDFKEASRNINKAIAIAPENSDILKFAASNALDLGKIGDALTLTKKAIELDPLNYTYYFNLALFYSWNKQYDEAETTLKKYVLMYPDEGFAHNFMAQILLGKGEYDKALIELEKDDNPFWNLYRKSLLAYAQGKTNEADDLLKKIIDEHGNSSWPNIAHIFAFRGEKDLAFKWLDLAFENKDASTLEILNYPEMENLWGDPRWNAFIDKLGLPKDHGFHRD